MKHKILLLLFFPFSLSFAGDFADTITFQKKKENDVLFDSNEPNEDYSKYYQSEGDIGHDVKIEVLIPGVKVIDLDSIESIAGGDYGLGKPLDPNKHGVYCDAEGNCIDIENYDKNSNFQYDDDYDGESGVYDGQDKNYSTNQNGDKNKNIRDENNNFNNADGYNADGYNADGYNADGYNADGNNLDKDGYVSDGIIGGSVVGKWNRRFSDDTVHIIENSGRLASQVLRDFLKRAGYRMSWKVDFDCRLLTKVNIRSNTMPESLGGFLKLFSLSARISDITEVVTIFPAHARSDVCKQANGYDILQPKRNI